jgi:hypothetical protein
MRAVRARCECEVGGEGSNVARAHLLACSADEMQKINFFNFEKLIIACMKYGMKYGINENTNKNM